MTVRWWFYLNGQATVYGIDMMREANDFTVKALSESFKEKYIPITAVLASETGRAFEVNFNDPLFGGNRTDAPGKYLESRRMRSSTLDECLRNYKVVSIDLLKVDIEGSAAQMFMGAAYTLSRVKNIMIEIHGEEERDESIRILNEKGFYVRRSYKRHVWLSPKKDDK